jgi:hypothetical protein
MNLKVDKKKATRVFLEVSVALYYAFTFMAMLGFGLGIATFDSGFHNIDIAYNFFRNSAYGYMHVDLDRSQECSTNNVCMPYMELYNKGVLQIVKGLILTATAIAIFLLFLNALLHRYKTYHKNYPSED